MIRFGFNDSLQILDHFWLGGQLQILSELFDMIVNITYKQFDY